MRGASYRKQQTPETMKPTILTTCNASCRDSFDPAMRSRRMSLITNYNYNSLTFESFRANCGRSSGRSFWNITGDYLKHEARHDFLGEAALFVSSLDQQRTCVDGICSCDRQLLTGGTFV
jgi:hypothetical protein